jgi:ribose transport system substrate-binding protein
LGLLVLVAALVALFATSTAAVSSTSAVSAQKCGQDVVYKAKDPDGVFKTLPKHVQARYGPYYYEIKKTPWEAFAGKPKPWKIGLVMFPIGSPWQANLVKQAEREVAKARAKGLVEGKLVKYIQPDFNGDVVAQQITAIQQLVRDGVDGILVLPLNSPPLAPAIDEAGKAGVPVVILDNVVAESEYVVNVWSQNNSPAAAGVLGLIKTGNVLIVRGIAGNAVEQAFHDAAIADIKACPGVKVVGTIYGKWNNADAKAEVVKWLAANPDVKVDAVIQHGIMMSGIIQAFQQAGQPIPPISGGGCQGGELAWWLKNKATYRSVATCFNGFQTAWSEMRLLFRILDGRGLKVRDIHVPIPIVTNENLHIYATPGKPLTWPGEPRGPINGWASNKFLDDYFKKPGTPGGL